MAQVLESGHSDYKKGDLVWGITKWEGYDGNQLWVIKIRGSAFLWHQGVSQSLIYSLFYIGKAEMMDIESSSFSWDKLFSLHHTEHTCSNEHSEDEMNRALEVAWEHEQFSRLRVTAATLSELSTAPELLERTGGLVDSRFIFEPRC
ncbi:dual specificity protein phosphatase phs1-like protein [Sesbania bispinosa]|nr:dual specificity protein phosphatase phs1-like protein [Sesbania bispinosa]